MSAEDMVNKRNADPEENLSSDPSELRAEVRLLREENQRLREAYAHSRRASYKRTARGLFAIGSAAVGGAILFPAVRQVLLALAAIGIFGAVLTYYLTPESFIAASVGERVYAALAQTADKLIDELGLATNQIYVPTEGPIPARLFIPQHDDDELPEPDALTDVLVVGENGTRGVSLLPTGGYLFREFEQTLTEPFGATPEAAVRQLTDALIENFELARGVDVDKNLEGTTQRVTVRVSGSTYGETERLDNPIASLLGVGLATAVESAVTVETVSDDDELLITCRWRIEETTTSITEDEENPEDENGTAVAESYEE